MQKNLILKTIFIIFLFFAVIIILNNQKLKIPLTAEKINITPTPILKSIPTRKILNNEYHIFQTYNNCGPASLSMALSYFNINKSQEELGEALRPYQNPYGDNDDKSVTLSELAHKAEEYQLITYHRPNGTVDMLKNFVAQGIPIITRSWLNPDEDIGHYRIIKGYDDSTKTIIQDDSFQGKNLEYSYDDFNLLWQKFNYEYLVLVPKNKQAIAEAILGKNSDKKTAWENAVRNAQKLLAANPDDIYTRFNLAVAYFNLGKYQESVSEYEKIEYQLPFRTLWYQIEPISAYFALNNYEKVLYITDSILNNENRAFSELYMLRGKIYQKQHKFALAKEEFEKAAYYNRNLKSI